MTGASAARAKVMSMVRIKNNLNGMTNTITRLSSFQLNADPLDDKMLGYKMIEQFANLPLYVVNSK